MKRSTSKQQSALTEIKKRLKIIFIFYSSFGDRDNYKLLKNQSYRRMLCDAQISRTEESVKEFDIIYSKYNKTKSGLTFKEFTDTLPDIAKSVYGEGQHRNQNIKNSLMKLIQEHFLVLEDHIMSKMDFGEDINCLKESHQISSFEILVQIKPILHKIYQQYWHPESKPTLEKCFSNLQNFMRDFQICPQLSNKSIAFVIFQSILEQQSEHAILQKFVPKINDNKLFSFKKFISCLVDLALIGARKQGMESDSQSSKIIYLLERMQLSNGFQKIQKLIQPSNIKPTLLVNQELYLSTPGKSKKPINFQSSFESQYNTNKNNSSYLEEYYSIQSMGKLKSPQNPGRLTVINKSPDRRKCTLLQFSESQSDMVRKYQNELRIRFEVFCSYGQTLNTITLKSIKLSKILKQIGILSFIKQHQLDLIISNLLRSSPSGKIQFPQFIKLLSQISVKIKMPFEKIIITILQYEGQSGQLARKVESKESFIIGNQDPQVYQLLDIIEKPLKIYFQFYSKNKVSLNFVQFSKFMYDFQLFPFLISKPRLFKIFNQIIDKFEVKQKQIDFQMFKEAMGLCSLQIVDSRLRKVEKLLLLLERMNDSVAPKVVLKSMGSTRNTYGMKVDFLGDARKKYSSFYQKDIFYQRSAKKKQEQNFDSIMLEF